MAKLSAHRRTELSRLERKEDLHRIEYAFMSDGKTLKKVTFWRPDGSGSSNTGWKVAHLKISVEEAKERLLANGFTPTK